MVTKSCPTLVTPYTKARPASLSITISQSLLRLMSTDPVMPFNPTLSSYIAPFSTYPQSFPESGSSSMSQLFASGGQSIGASASASVFAMNIQGRVLLGLTGLISLLPKELSRVFSSTRVQKHQFFGPQDYLLSNS